MALLNGIAVLDKVKTSLSRPIPVQPNSKPDDTSLAVSIQEATFKWETTLKSTIEKENDLNNIEKPTFSLSIKNLVVKKNSIIGITGEDESGKTSLILALLGHMPHRSGDYRRSGAISYYSEKPFMVNHFSIQQNIMFAGDEKAKLDEGRYKDAISTVQMHMNQGFDLLPMDKHGLDEQWLQRISMARAVYEER